MSNPFHCPFTYTPQEDGTKLAVCPNCGNRRTVPKQAIGWVVECKNGDPLPGNVGYKEANKKLGITPAECRQLAMLGDVETVAIAVWTSAEKLGISRKDAISRAKMFLEWRRRGYPTRTEAEQAVCRDVCKCCWNRPTCFATESLGNAMIVMANGICPIDSWRWNGHGPGDELHRSIEWWTGEKVTPTCGCGNWITTMNRNGCDWCVKHMGEIVDKMAEEANKRQGWKAKAAAISGAKVAMKRIVLAAVNRARQWPPAPTWTGE